ncbi:MAG: ribonuclease P protein component [Candidatus Melainabacteria bacterium]|nr:ribonuclease P protein component [Candidatus Melainabacteria bacterium]
MLAKPERLKEKYLFNIAFKKRQKVSSDLLSLYYLFKRKDINKLNKSSVLSKAAFIVGLRIDKRASRRNLIKRRMRSAYRLIRKKYFSENSKNDLQALIWIANPNIKNATFEQIKSSMERLLNKLEKSGNK